MHRKTVEELSNSYLSQDMWDSFDNEEPRKKMLRFENGVKYELRFLGPFFKARRTYINDMPYLQDSMSVDELKSIVRGNKEIFLAVHKKLNTEKFKIEGGRKSPQGLSFGNSSPTIPSRRVIAEGWGRSSPYAISPTNDIASAINTLVKLYESSKWQRCVMVNALVKYEGGDVLGLKVVVLNKQMVLHNQSTPTGLTNEKCISGLNAYDIMVERHGSGLQTQYEMTTSSAPSLLSEIDMQRVFSEGLIDISEVIKDTNRNSANQKCSYFYKKVSDYKMPKEMCSVLFEELANINATKAVDDVDDKLGSLPDEAFENRATMFDPIACLEL